jgi:hypothetical protein
MLYAGTEKALPLLEWSKDAPTIWVRPLVEGEEIVRSHFSKPTIQYIGATSGCGCDFPHSLLNDGEWLSLEKEAEETSLEEQQTYRSNGHALMNLLRDFGEGTYELYAFWAGNGTKTPLAVESIPLQGIVDPDFRFREQVFYKIHV